MKELVTKIIAWIVMIASGVIMITTEADMYRLRNIALIMIMLVCAITIWYKDYELGDSDDEFEDIES